MVSGVALWLGAMRSGEKRAGKPPACAKALRHSSLWLVAGGKSNESAGLSLMGTC